MTSVTPGVGVVTGAGLAPVLANTSPTVQQSDVQRVAVSATSAGDNTLVAAVSAHCIRVVAAVLVASGGTNTATFQSGAGGLAIGGATDFPNDAQLVLPYNPAGWCETGIGEPLVLNLSDAHAVEGMLTYVLAG